MHCSNEPCRCPLCNGLRSRICILVASVALFLARSACACGDLRHRGLGWRGSAAVELSVLRVAEAMPFDTAARRPRWLQGRTSAMTCRSSVTASGQPARWIWGGRPPAIIPGKRGNSSVEERSPPRLRRSIETCFPLHRLSDAARRTPLPDDWSNANSQPWPVGRERPLAGWPIHPS